MDSRELVQLAKALTGYDSVTVRNVTLTVETGDGIKDYVLHSNDDLFRPFHVNEELSFDDAEAVLEYVTQ
jgi:hypothetical protein